VQNTATLRLLDKADKQIRQLPRAVKGAVYEFQYKFRENPNAPGINLETLQGSDQLLSARVTKDYRALLLHVGDNDYVLLGVRPHQHVYDRLDRYRPQVNRVTGGLEFVEVVPSTEAAPDTPAVPTVAEEPAEAEEANAFLGGVTPEQLRELGVTEVLIPSAMAVHSEDELLSLVNYAPSLTEEVLLALADGHAPDAVMEQVTRPVTTEEEVDPADFTAALQRSATRVTTSDTDLAEAIEDAFNRWKVFLHPTQRKLVTRSYRGPARVSGGPGTGKTIVALHRVKHLVEQLPPGRSTKVLLTTFNKNLAADLRRRLLDLAGPEVVQRVDIRHVDQVANRIVTEASTARPRRRINDGQALEEWQDMLTEQGENGWDAEFLNAEWEQVILGQGIRTRGEYFRARRVGRGRRISRAQRAEIWQLVERFTMRLDEKHLSTYRQIAAQAADIKRRQAESIREHRRREADQGGAMLHRQAQSWDTLRYDYDHIVVDEAQDLSAAHWTMLRAMVPEQDNDLFLVGDPHQRIYDRYVSLGGLGINIRGRSSRLTLSYRTTRQILGSALRMLGTEQWDDLDEGSDDLAGYRSVLKGAEPRLHGAASWEEELGLLAETVGAWKQEEMRRAETEGRAVESNAIAVAVPTRDKTAEVQRRLTEAGIRSVPIGPDGPPEDPEAVHVGTLYRFKGLEYRHVAVAAACDGELPRAEVHELRRTDPQRYAREMQRARSLLFVAATRARDSLTITWHGPPSPFVPQ
jgi:superfamily I DNA/RNA helicase